MNQPGIFPFLDQIIKELRKLFSPLRIDSVRDLLRTDGDSNTTQNFQNVTFLFESGNFMDKSGRFHQNFSLTFNQNIFTSKLFLFHLNDFSGATIQQCAIHQVSIITLLNFILFFRSTLKVII